jgi:hypothetical protein
MTIVDKLVFTDRVKFMVGKRIGKAAGQCTTVDIEELSDELVATLETSILSEKKLEKTIDVCFRFPANWWEHLKFDLLKIAPKKYIPFINVKLHSHITTIRIDQFLVYPKADEVLIDRWGTPVLHETIFGDLDTKL